jgi:AraC-like DNA-binding protein
MTAGVCAWYGGWRDTTRVVVAPALVLECIVGLGLVAGGSLTETVTEMMVRMVVVVGLYIFVGNSGIISFGHISFMAIGAYAAAWLTCCTLPMVKPLYLPGLPEWLQNTAEPFWTGLAAAAILSGVVAAAIGLAIMRLSGIAASIATFGILAVEFNIYSNWDSMTAGTSSVSNIPISIDPFSASLFAAAAIVVAAVYQNSRFGVAARPDLHSGTVARALRLSPRYLQKIFADRGETLSRVIKVRRIAEARRLLERNESRKPSVAQVAYAVGFDDIAHFSRAFREITGMAPSTYRGGGNLIDPAKNRSCTIPTRNP